MKKFEFKLEKLLQIRKDKEEEQKRELAKASGAYQLEVNRREKLKENVVIVRRKLQEDRKSMSLAEIQAYDRLQTRAEEDMAKLEPQIEQKRVLMQRELDKFTELKKDRRAVELLKEKALERWKAENNLEEQKDMDEIGKNQFLKRKDTGMDSDN